MLAETQIIRQPTIPVLDAKQYLRVSPKPSNPIEDMLDVVAPGLSPSSPTTAAAAISIFSGAVVSDSKVSRLDSVVSCSGMIEDSMTQSTSALFEPQIRSGSSCDIGCRSTMEDEHICIDDLFAHLGTSFKCPLPGAFYGVFDGHRGAEAAAFIKENAVRFFIEDSYMPETTYIDSLIVEELKDSHRKAFLSADLALANDCCASLSSGTTVLTALVLGRCLLVANAGDCRAVLSRNGVAVEMSHDHKTSYPPERKRVEELGAFIEDEYLNGLISVTRALGDWDMKLPSGTFSALIAEPDFQQVTLTEDDEFLIIACDGVWDVMSSQQAVSFVRRGLRSHNNPQQCAEDLVAEALRLNTCDNLTVIVICFLSQIHSIEPQQSTQRRRRFCLSEESRERLKRLFEGN
ncbi:hypothetical protein QQ045_030583 [Rhodiola kirilowii]